MLLADKSVIVTGATGIAAAGALRFGAEGASVFVVSLNEADCVTLADQIDGAGGTVAWAAADLTREEDAETSFAAAAERFGRIDGLFAVVGASGRRFGDGPADAIPLEGWDRTLAINARPPFLAAREAIRLMQKQQPTESGSRGSVVLVSSVLAAHPSPKLFATHAYAAAKGAIISLTRAMASYYAPAGVRVNAVAPGLVETPMSHRAADDEATVTYAARKQPLAGGFLSPGDVAAAACFFLSDDSIRVTGQVLEVDGGWSVTEAPA